MVFLFTNVCDMKFWCKNRRFVMDCVRWITVKPVSKKEDLKERGDCYFSVTRGPWEPTPHQTKTKSDKCSQIKGATQKDHRVLVQHIYLFCRAATLNDESDSSLRFFRSVSAAEGSVQHNKCMHVEQFDGEAAAENQSGDDGICVGGGSGKSSAGLKGEKGAIEKLFSSPPSLF